MKGIWEVIKEKEEIEGGMAAGGAKGGVIKS